MHKKHLSIITVVFAAILSACGGGDSAEPATVAEGSAGTATPSTQKYSAEAFYQTTAYRLVGPAAHAFSADGSALLISSDQTGVFNAYRMPVDGSDPEPLTSSDDNAVFAVSWFPDDDRILYTYDSGGNELNHVIVRELDGTSRDLTPGEDLKASFAGWHDDGAHFYVATTERNQQSFDLYRYSATDYSRELVFENPGLLISALSGDGQAAQRCRLRHLPCRP
jgi:hypothetical protein